MAGRRRRRSGTSGTTTAKVSRLVALHIAKNAYPNESADHTLRRLIGISKGRNGAPKKPPISTTIKIARDTMREIKSRAKRDESRDETIRRLLGLKRQDGNVEVGP